MLANLSELSTVRTNWTEAYVTELILKVDTAIENFLGLDKQQSLREATDLLNNIMTPALRDLAFVKTQIEVDFSKEAGEMLKTLGLNINIHSVNQEGLKEAVDTFNGIYTEVIGIGKIASKFYQNDRLKKDQFTFTKVVKKMGIAPKKEEDPVTP
ncbi:MAG: hypothetical protein Q8R96_20245 [Bacteroidota bacterium]|nr:hypothetical protein [Bacteroidota bacterium]